MKLMYITPYMANTWETGMNMAISFADPNGVDMFSVQ